ncbi:PIN domain-like protein [Rickenella mellea]|uniref:PIN domain-like protein n=1 Tax=Rickenella mellea TaxID=50990 RepID=A0A4R5XFR1_9AGAM|nr:PIN domain-like protein [Rickenella mellea]
MIGWSRLATELRQNDTGLICVFDGEKKRPKKLPTGPRQPRESKRVSSVRGMLEPNKIQKLSRPRNATCTYQSTNPDSGKRARQARKITIAEAKTVERGVQGAEVVPPEGLSHLEHDEEVAVEHAARRSNVHDGDGCEEAGEGCKDLKFVKSHGVLKVPENPSQFDIIFPAPQSEKTVEQMSSPEDPSEGSVVATGRATDDSGDGGESNTHSGKELAPNATQVMDASTHGMSFLLDLRPVLISKPKDSTNTGGDHRGHPYGSLPTSADMFPSKPKKIKKDSAQRRRTMPVKSVSATKVSATIPKSRKRSNRKPGNSKVLQVVKKSKSKSKSVPAKVLIGMKDRSTYIPESFGRRGKAPKSSAYKESKMLLEAMGVPWIQVEDGQKANAVASSLVLNGHADFVASDDMDVLIHGAPLLRNLVSDEKPLITISSIHLREALHLDRDSFVDFALLLGTDFSERIKDFGPARVLNLIQKHGSIERVLVTEKRVSSKVYVGKYLEQTKRARQVFRNLTPVPDSKFLRPREIDEEALARIVKKFKMGDALKDSASVSADK